MRGVALCFAAFFVRSFERWAVNIGYYPEVGLFFPESRELATVSTVLFYLALAFLARHRPSLFNIKVLVLTCLLCSFFGCLILELALQAQSPFETLVGMTVRLFANGLVTVLLGAALSSIGNALLAMLVVVGSSALASFVTAFLPIPNSQLGVVITFGILIAASLLSYRPAKPLLDAISSSDAPIDLELSNPNAFISWRSGIYVCFLFFGIILGISLTFAGGEQNHASYLITGVLEIAIIAWFIASKTKRREDSLFSIAVILAITGLAFMPIESSLGMLIAQTAPIISVGIFVALIWILVYSVSAKNAFAVLPTLCVLWAMQSLGVLVGALLGHRLGTPVMSTPEFFAAALVVFFAWLWTRFRAFNFHETIQSLTGLTLEESQEISKGAAGISIEEACEELGNRYGLTKRETEIFELLARGRNGSYIQEKYVISRNTAKTHIRNIYAKLDVHSHQELIDFVESFKDEDG